MRVDQIISLVWIGNLALLGGTGWVGWQFWEQKRSAKPAAAPQWPDGGPGVMPPQRWPGPPEGFTSIWKTPLSGMVPPPPEVKKAENTAKLDPVAALRSRVQIEGAIPATDPWASLLLVKDNGPSGAGKVVPLAPGQSLDEWKLTRVEVDRRSGRVAAWFESRQHAQSDVLIERTVPELGNFIDENLRKFVPEFDRDGAVRPGGVPAERVETQAFRDAGGEWQVPLDEVRWLEEWGEREVLAKTRFKERPEGLEFATMPATGPLDSGRGFSQGDVLVSVNGVAVRSVADVLAYLRGDGRGLVRYVVVVERDGARRTQVYNVARARPRN